MCYLGQCLADINGECEQEGANFCIEVSSSDKRDKILLTKQPKGFYYNSKGREECSQGNVPMHVSLHHLIVTEK